MIYHTTIHTYKYYITRPPIESIFYPRAIRNLPTPLPLAVRRSSASEGVGVRSWPHPTSRSSCRSRGLFHLSPLLLLGRINNYNGGGVCGVVVAVSVDVVAVAAVAAARYRCAAVASALSPPRCRFVLPVYMILVFIHIALTR